MKRLAIFIGGLLVLPAFGEVAPVFYEDGIEYSDVVYDENGNPILLDEYGLYSDSDVDDGAINSSVQNSRTSTSTRSNTNRTTVGRTVPATASTAASNRVTAANSSRAVASRGASGATSARTTSSRAVSSRGTTSRTTSTAATRTTPNVAATRAAATRATGGAGRATAASTRAGASGAGTVARTTTSRATTSGRTATAANSSRATISRAAARPSVITTAGSASPVYLNSSNVAGTNNLVTLNSSGTTYNSFDSNNRASVRGNRAPTIRVSTMNNLSTVADVSVTAADLSAMDELAEMTDYCKAQYAACMDNYCNVLDDNQGRCSCSANITNYAQAEAALKSATEELQEVAQKIQYIGLSAREVETLFTQTEAELKMQTTTDTSQLKTSLDKVRDMIIEVQSGTASSNTSTGLSFDLSGLLDFTIDSTGFDLSALWGGLTGNTSGINNQRGAQLFNTATNRCKTNVLRSCTAAGVDASLITNAYDLEIDKECIAYERSLNDSNDQMVATVRNAKSVLQKARLLVEQSKNEYDMRGCINALDSCMQDEYVCGTDYEKCLDPSGRYIVNGEIVIGSDPGRAVNGIGDNENATGVLNGNVCDMNLYNVWNYGENQTGITNPNCKNAWNSYSLNGNNNGNLSDYIDKTISLANAKSGGLGMSEFIQNKIGYNEKDRNYGMCMSVLNKCQDYTYTGNGSSRKYDAENEVVKQYLARMLVQIKAKQDEILAEHAESCITDVTTCLTQNNYPFDEETLTVNNVRANIAINACRSPIVTCMSVNGYSVVNPTPTDMSRWVCGITTGTTDCSGNDGSGDNPTGDNPITVSLYNADTLFKTLYYNNGNWYSDNSANTQVWRTTAPSKTGYKFRGFGKNNISDVTSSQGALSNQVINSQGVLGDLSGNTTKLYAAWAKECVEPANGTCGVNIGVDGSVTYWASCNNGGSVTGANTATPSCGATQNYTITFNCNDGSGTTWTETHPHGTEVSLPNQRSIGQHCSALAATSFTGWKDANGREANSSITITNDISLFAQWGESDDRWGSTDFGDGRPE